MNLNLHFSRRYGNISFILSSFLTIQLQITFSWLRNNSVVTFIGTGKNPLLGMQLRCGHFVTWDIKLMKPLILCKFLEINQVCLKIDFTSPDMFVQHLSYLDHIWKKSNTLWTRISFLELYTSCIRKKRISTFHQRLYWNNIRPSSTFYSNCSNRNSFVISSRMLSENKIPENSSLALKTFL